MKDPSAQPAPVATMGARPASVVTADAERIHVVLADGRGLRHGSPEPTRTALRRFAVGTVLVLAPLLVAAWVLGGQAAENEGVDDVRRLTQVLARTVVEPALEDAVVSGDPDATARLDDLVRQRLLGDAGISRVKLWDPSGLVVYSDERRLVGRTFDLEDDQRRVLAGGETASTVTGLLREENAFEGRDELQLLEVYTAVTTPSGQPLLLEMYFTYDVVLARQDEILRSFVPIAVVGLLVFAVLQTVLVYLNLRWLRQQRERLLADASRVADIERRKLAADLHDSIVQDLVGASLVVSAAATTLGAQGLRAADSLSGAARRIRASVQGLRSMLVDLYPTGLQAAGLRAALDDLVAPLRAGGTTVELALPDDVHLGAGGEAVLYRVAQEACRNVVRHANAGHVELAVTNLDRFVRLTVRDDGAGFEPRSAPRSGHLGLRVLADLADNAGGRLVISSAPGLGTVVELWLPR